MLAPQERAKFNANPYVILIAYGGPDCVAPIAPCRELVGDRL
jgi:hypothetical protein